MKYINKVIQLYILRLSLIETVCFKFKLMIVLVVLNLLFIKALNGTNFAKNSNVDCEGKVLSPKLTDGDRSSLVYYKSVVCDFLIVEMGGAYTIHYIFIMQSHLPSYRVNLLTDNKDPDIEAFNCGLYYNLLVVGSRNVSDTTFQRTNCETYDTYFDSVKITNEIVGHHTFVEIEAHGIGIAKPNRKNLIYRGCYSLANSRLGAKRTDKDLNTCYEQCIGYGYAAIQETTCVCVNEFDDRDEIDVTKCNFKCTDSPDKYCGGRKLYSLYLIHLQLPYYKGCYANPKSECRNRTCRFEKIIKDVELNYLYICMLRCKSWKYLNLKQDYCWCNDELQNEETDSKCTQACRDGTLCGSASHFSVYGTCYTKWSKVQCSLLLRCENGFDNYGKCDLAGCQEGWKGDYCLERDMGEVTFDYEYTNKLTQKAITTTKQPITQKQGQPKTKKPGQPKTQKPGSATPAKSPGQVTTPNKLLPPTVAGDSGTITETDGIINTLTAQTNENGETYGNFCQPDSCERKLYSQCVSSKNGFVCNCGQGFIEIDDICKDVDECTENKCDGSAIRCENTVGNFSCSCISGFVMTEKGLCVDQKKPLETKSGIIENWAMTIFYAACLIVILGLIGIYCYDTKNAGTEETEEEEG